MNIINDIRYVGYADRTVACLAASLVRLSTEVHLALGHGSSSSKVKSQLLFFAVVVFFCMVLKKKN